MRGSRSGLKGLLGHSGREAHGLVIFAHGSGQRREAQSAAKPPHTTMFARCAAHKGRALANPGLLIDLLTGPAEGARPGGMKEERLRYPPSRGAPAGVAVSEWGATERRPPTGRPLLGYFGAKQPVLLPPSPPRRDRDGRDGPGRVSAAEHPIFAGKRPAESTGNRPMDSSSGEAETTQGARADVAAPSRGPSNRGKERRDLRP